MPSSFSIESRRGLCPHCRHPLELPIPGGKVRCNRCRQLVMVSARRFEQDRRAVVAAEAMDEGERLAKLRAELARVVAEGVPDDISPPGPPDLGLEAWQRLREAVGSGAADRAETWVALTEALLTELPPEAQRALLEATADLLPRAEHRAQIWCRLAELAVRCGHPADGEAWLAAVNPQSTDLAADTAYRLAQAAVAAARGDDVIRAVGASVVEVPFHPSRIAESVLFRSFGLETSHHAEAAEHVLVDFMRSDPRHPCDVDRAAERVKALWFCPASYPEARRKVWKEMDAVIRPSQQISRGERRARGGCLAAVLLFAAAGAAFILWTPLGGLLAISEEGAEGLGGTLLMCSAIGLLVSIILVLGDNRQRQRLGRQGVLCCARVSNVRMDTRDEGNLRVHYCQFQLSFHLPSGTLSRPGSLRRTTPLPAGDYVAIVNPSEPKYYRLYLGDLDTRV